MNEWQLTHYYHNFDWSNAPLNSMWFALTVSLSYSLLCALYSRSQPLPRSNQRTSGHFLQKLIPWHNLILSFGSLIMFGGSTFEVYNRVRMEGIGWMFCEKYGMVATGPLFFWSYVYYLSKFYELLDTFLQLLQGKTPPHFLLHSYHHACVIMMCWCWLQYCPTLQFIGIMFNTFVHVVMYFYFYLRSIGISPWWKKYVTIVQIIQFVTSGICFLVTMYLVHGVGQTCNGNFYLYVCIAFNMSLLLGFVNVLSLNTKREKKL